MKIETKMEKRIKLQTQKDIEEFEKKKKEVNDNGKRN